MSEAPSWLGIRYVDGVLEFPKYNIKIIETGDYDIVLVEEYPCSTKDELFKRERYYIENNTCINKHAPSMTRSK